ncbi:hydantoinase/oxoprolinase family protein [Desulfopila aestuarii]|uniref:N-methylhydantoinase A/oxoprolinase/acetone carboxylase, beta subunit n=1 Tax=Desulfopila aestuarii DSM 18488 TaxID=1121416 RepID=A0A1M7XW06_9BACT|nr:hydantoinase/oxoprolinase family protein [Desulfopila aestuarii]SHO42907.1 N-methylhydantoinase A/oxoprolinase/acetone carboxylase, beta subunit [Desulfopila aestuarii DSM 18488]
MQKYIIGIDTGGTFTDAVLLEQATGRIIASAKKATTHQQLAIGTGEALAALLETAQITPENISSLTVSSTLATNSVVENKGARVALLIIGYVRHFRLPVKAVIYIKGGHTITGDEEEPLDLDYLVEIVNGLKNEVDAYGVCSAMSIKNPTHELVAEKAISMIDPKPVFCSHRTSDVAGMKERAATAGLHAKLMPIMQEYLAGIKEAMRTLGLTCPISIVSGNGSTISSDKAVEFAGSTVASGPACTAHFGALQTREDALVIDVGGTTTDIAMIKDGAPILAAEGCQIGGWRTHVEAVDMVTGGIGGDSHVMVDTKGSISLGPGRVMPLAMSRNTPDIASWLGTGEKAKLIVGRPEKLAGQDHEVADCLLRLGPTTLHGIKAATGLAGVPLEKTLEQMANLQHIYECGFTPTDALHVLGRIDIGDAAAARLGAEILGAAAGLDAEEFSRSIIAKAEEKIENLIIDYLIQHYWGNSLAGFLNARNDHPVLGVNFSLKIPLIGIGAAARHLLPAVAERLGTSISFPDNCEVGNAIGAAMIGATNLNC